jgi:hypothetical protein
MTADELSPEHEERLIGEMLHERADIDLSRLGPVNLAARDADRGVGPFRPGDTYLLSSRMQVR